MGLSSRTPSPTSCIRSLSLVTMITSRSCSRGLAGERADHVVGFISGIFQDREDAWPRNTGARRESAGKAHRAWACAALCRQAKSLSRNVGAADIEDYRDIVGAQILVLEKPPHHGGEQIGDFRGHSGVGLQSRSIGAKKARKI